MRHYLPGYRTALHWAHPAPQPEPNSSYIKYWTNWTRRFWKSFQNKSEFPPCPNRQGIKTVDLAGNQIPKFGRQRSQSFSGGSSNPTTPNFNSHFGNFRQAARNLFVNSVLKRVTNNHAKNLRRRTAQQLLVGGNSAPFLALVGVSLASGNGILTKEDEIECVCKEVRNAARKVTQLDNDKDLGNFGNQHWSLNDFNIGPVISKGCSAVVYAAKCLKNGFESLGNEGINYQV